MNEMLIDPFTSGQVRAFHSTWERCSSSLEELGVRNLELRDNLERAIKHYLGARLTPETETQVREALTRTARDFEKRHTDLRIVKCDIVLRLGNFDIDLQIDKSHLSFEETKKLHPLIWHELTYEYLVVEKMRGRQADLVVFDDLRDLDIRSATAGILDNIAYADYGLTRGRGESDDGLRSRCKHTAQRITQQRVMNPPIITHIKI